MTTKLAGTRCLLTGPMRSWRRSVAICALTLATGACSSASYVAPLQTIPVSEGLAETAQAAAAAPNYQINPGDDLTVRLYYNPQLDEDVHVRPDGKISLSLVGDVPAAGMTTAQLSQAIGSRYAVYLMKPDSMVILRRASDERAFFGGEVVKPGVIDLNAGPETVLQGISTSGGLTDQSDPSRVIVVRRLPGKPDPIVMELDVKSALQGTGRMQDIQLVPGDIVYVPRSGVADLNLALRQYLWNNLNLSTSVSAGVIRTIQ